MADSAAQRDLVQKLECEVRACLEQLRIYEGEIEALRLQKSVLQKELKEKKGLAKGF